MVACLLDQGRVVAGGEIGQGLHPELREQGAGDVVNAVLAFDDRTEQVLLFAALRIHVDARGVGLRGCGEFLRHRLRRSVRVGLLQQCRLLDCLGGRGVRRGPVALLRLIGDPVECFLQAVDGDGQKAEGEFLLIQVMG